VSRFLVVVPPFTGHVTPLLGVAAELEGRGHEVAWAGLEEHLRLLLAPQATVFGLATPLSADELAPLERRADAANLFERLRLLWEDIFLPLARETQADVDGAVARFEPDVLVVDQHTLAGAIAARRRDLPWATSANTWWSLLGGYETMPKVREWLVAHLAVLQREAGLEPVDWPDRSPHAILVYATREIVPHAERLPPQTLLVGPTLAGRDETATFPWERLDAGRPTVFVTLGTVNEHLGGRFYAALVEGLAGGEEQLVFAAPPEVVPLAPNVLAQRHVPALDVMRHADAVVCHAGTNTICEALAHGLPLVVAPIKDDQPLYAGAVEEAGVGVRVRFRRSKPAELAGAVRHVLSDERYRNAAKRVRASFERAGGSRGAADALERLAVGPESTTPRGRVAP
jgi:MGT family glycosyltransferase